MAKFSVGLRDYMLVNGSMRGALLDGSIILGKGTPPANAEDAVNAPDILCTILLDGTDPLNLDVSATAGVVSKPAAEEWSGEVAQGGTCTWFRHVADGDANDASQTAPRIQGSVGVMGADLNLSSVALVQNAIQTIDYYSVALPSL